MKRVCFVNDDFSMGGIQKVNVYLGEEIAKNGVEVFFYTTKEEPSIFYKIEKGSIYRATYTRNEKIYKDLQRAVRKIKRTIRMEYGFNKRDVIIRKLIRFLEHKEINTVLLNGPVLISYIPIIKEQLPHIRCIGWIHNSYRVYLENDYNSYTKHFRTSFFKGLISADKIVCLTNIDLVEYKKFNKNTVCIYNPLTLSVNGAADLESKNIAFLCRVAIQHKGLDYLAEIASCLPEPWKIAFGGNGTLKNKRIFKDNINKFRANNKIDILGAMDEYGIKKLFESSSVYLMTSRWEGMPLVLAEAMSFGLPIIAFDQSGSREVLADGKYGILVEQGNVSKMNHQLRRLMDSPTLREEYSQKSLDRVKHFNIKTIAEKWLEIL